MKRSIYRGRLAETKSAPPRHTSSQQLSRGCRRILMMTDACIVQILHQVDTKSMIRRREILKSDSSDFKIPPFLRSQGAYRGAFSSPSPCISRSISALAWRKPRSPICFVRVVSSLTSGTASEADCAVRSFCAAAVA